MYRNGLALYGRVNRLRFGQRNNTQARIAILRNQSLKLLIHPSNDICLRSKVLR